MKTEKFLRLYILLIIIIKGFKSWRFQLSLTLLTMIIGAFTLSSTFFIADGALEGLWKELDSLVGNKLDIYPDSGPNDALIQKRGNFNLSSSDLEYLKQRIKGAKYIVPVTFKRGNVKYNDKEHVMYIDGISSELLNEKIYTPIKGSVFSDNALSGNSFECYITESAMHQLKIDNINDNPYIRIDMIKLKIIGIVPDIPEVEGVFSYRVIIPYQLAQLSWGKPGVISTISVFLWQAKDLEGIVKQVEKYLDICRSPGAYRLSSTNFKLKKRKNIVSNFMIFGSIQALFCILVASIGTVNVMLSNVIRRTKEFAVRIVMGASIKDISSIVLTESLILGLTGGCIGVLISVIATPALCELLGSKMSEASSLTPIYSARGVVITLLVCGLSSTFAGIIPAIRAKKIDILEVLRAE